MALTKISGSILKDPLNLGEVSIGGTLTYQDVTNVDSIGIGTFNDGINVIGHTELDNVNIAGVSTFAETATFNKISDSISMADSLVHTGNTGTKLQFHVNAVELHTSGQQRLQINSGGNLIFKSPNNNTGEQPASLRWINENNAGDMGKIALIREAVSQAPGALAFYTSPNVDTSANGGRGDITERLRITSSGRLGIGITNPSTELDVKGNIRMRQVNGNSGVNSDNIALYMGMSDDLNQGKTAIIAKPIGSWGRHDLYFCLDNVADLNDVGLSDAKMVLTNDGNLVINQTSASGTKLAIQSTASSGSGTATGIRVGNNIGALTVYPANIEVRTTGVSDYNAIRTDAGDGNGGFTCGVEGYNGFLNLTTGGNNLVNVKLHTSGVSYLNGGNIGINSTAPSKKLDVRGNTIANQFLARSAPTSSYTTSTTGFKYGARGSYALSIGGTRSSNGSSFTICDIKDFNNSKFFRIEISFAHAGGGIHGSYRKMSGICNGYTSIHTWSDTGNVNTGGGGGFTISKPDNHTLRIVWNGASSYADHYTLYCLVNVSYEGSYFSYIDSAFY